MGQQAVLLKKVVDAMKDLCKDVNFDCSEKGIQVQSMDSSHVALVSLLLRECAFADFKCDRPTSLGMNVDSLSKVFKICGPNDSLKLKWQNDADTLNFQCENSSTKWWQNYHPRSSRKSAGTSRSSARRCK